MSDLLAHVIPLALGAAISPLLLIVQVYVLSGGRQPIIRALSVTVGALIALGGFTLILVFFFHGTSALSGGKSTTSAYIHFGAALLLLLLGLRNLKNRDKDSSSANRAKKIADARSSTFLVVGIVIMLFNVTSLVLIAPAIHDIEAASVSTSDKVLAYILLMVIALLPLAAPLIVTVAMGSKSAPFLAKLNQFVTDHNAVINACVCFGFAVYLLVNGVLAL